MKLSWKFFCLAYIIVLLSTGLGSFFLVKNTTDTLWNERVERCKNAEIYAVESFISLSELRVDDISNIELAKMKKQILAILDECVNYVEIQPMSEDSAYKKLTDYECGMDFVTSDRQYTLNIGCRVPVGEQIYVVESISDFSSIESYCTEIWNRYRITVLVIGLLSGALLFAVASKITKPLNELSSAAKLISNGEYGTSVNIKGGSSEIKELSNNFNKMSEIVAKSLEEVKEECRKRDAFVSNFAHEIKTPMTSIIGYSDMISNYDLTEDELKSSATEVYKEGKRLEKLAMQLLDLFVTKESEVEFLMIPFEELKEYLTSVFKFRCEEFRVALNIDFPNGIVWGNKELILSLLYNLTDNALKASKEGSTVFVSAEEQEHSYKIFVVDTGHGIKKEHINRITEAFYREDKARSSKKGGTGLGLSICEEICKIHQTKLEITSIPNEGTKVFFSLKKAGE